MTERQASGRTRRTVRGVALFLLVWMIVPSLFRFGAFACLVPEFGDLRTAALTGGWALLTALPQDLFIALEALVLAALLKPLLGRVFPGRAVLVLAVLMTVLFALVHFYLLFDFLLYNKTSIRMDPAFLDFLPVAASFASSISAGSLMVLAGGALAILVSLRPVFRVLRQSARSLRPSWWLVPALPAVGMLAVASRTGMPAQVGYAVDNLILNDQVRIVSALAGQEAALSPADETLARELLRPRAERCEPVSEEYPLLKRTEGFTGSRQFELAIRPGERNDLAAERPEQVRRYDAEAAAVHQLFLKLYLTERFISPELLRQMRSEPDLPPKLAAPAAVTR